MVTILNISIEYFINKASSSHVCIIVADTGLEKEGGALPNNFQMNGLKPEFYILEIIYWQRKLEGRKGCFYFIIIIYNGIVIVDDF